jgi:3-hydroxy-9,10-secoandrosta-1,3,5(10)-triene-9,17-dione monooxygenase
MATAAADRAAAAELLERARALRPVLLERQAETEERTCYSEETHRDLLDAGFYRMLVPRRYGGLELDLVAFARVIIELARGCPSTGWSVCLASGHALQVASWFGEQAQDEIFGPGDFRCPAVAKPHGTARRNADGSWTLNGAHNYASGSPYGTHYLGQSVIEEEGGEGAEPRMLLFVAPRSEWTVLDDWGDTLGLRGTGSNSIRFDDARIPAYFALDGASMLDVDIAGGSPGSRLHGNPIYAGRAMSFFMVEQGALVVGMAKGALDEYERIIRSRVTVRPPIVPRYLDPEYQRWFGLAAGRLEAAEAMLIQLAQQWEEASRRNVEEGIPFGREEDFRMYMIGVETIRLVWDTVQDYIYRTAGSGAARRGQRLERYYRDLSMAWGHNVNVFADRTAREYGQARLGVTPAD